MDNFSFKVLPSQRQGQKTSHYKVWVCLNKKHGWVLTGNCTCMAGLGSSCSHIAALLFKLEAAVHFQFNEKRACTSELCAWKASRKSVQPAPLSAIDFGRPKKHTLPAISTRDILVKNYSCSDPTTGSNPISNEKLSALYKISPNSAIFTSLDVSAYIDNDNDRAEAAKNVHHSSGSDTDSVDESEDSCIPEPLTSLFLPSSINMSDEELYEFGKSRYYQYVNSYYQKVYDNLQEVTKKQSLSNAWMVHRAGRVTASVCFQVSRMKNNPSLVNSIMQYTTFTSRFTEYGKETEQFAKQKFHEMEGNNHKDFQLNRVGLQVDADYPFLGATPDGLVTCSCHGLAVLEVKCPYNFKESLDGWQNDKNFPIDESLEMKQDHKYYFQIQLQMDLCQAGFGYFFIYSGGSKEGILCIVPKNEHFVKELKATLQEKFFNFILPEVICRKMDDKLDHDRSLYCVCRRPKFGHMIFCENETCKTKCYHYTCLDIARHPKGPWFCNDCKKMKLI